MSIKTRVTIFTASIAVIVVVAIIAHFCGLAEHADFALALLTAFSVGIAVVAAVYGNRLTEVVDPANVILTLPLVSNTVIDHINENGLDHPVYCHHLQITNKTKHKKIENCRVWLIRIEDATASGWVESFKFAVPRLMQWAPCEFEPTTRSFCDYQVFDLGNLWMNLGQFRITYFKDQGGTFDGTCHLGNKRRYTLKVEADNLSVDRRFQIEVSVEKCGKTSDWNFPCRTNVRVA